MNFFKLALALFLLCPLFPSSAQGPSSSESTSRSISLVSLDTIIPITYDNNQQIAAAKYDLQAAEYAFKEFERDLSQFTPFLFNADITRETRSFVSDATGRRTVTDYDFRTRAGVQKEFFDGSSIFGGVGYRGHHGDGGEGGNPFAETEIRFPLFSSFTTLRRITDRSFEENQVLNTRLDYVNEVRSSVQNAQSNYFWLEVMLERVDLADAALRDFHALEDLPRAKATPADRARVENEIQTAQSERIRFESDTNSYRVYLQDRLGLASLSLSQVDRINLHATDFYGRTYLERPIEEITAEARSTDAEVRVLELAKKNSELKKGLAQKGKWDIFGKLSAEYDFTGAQDMSDQNGYVVGAGIDVRRIDPGLLSLSLKRAEAEINKFDAKIRRRQQELDNFIAREVAKIASLRAQVVELEAGVASRRAVYEQKLSAYGEGRETMDNLVLARKTLFDTQIDLTDVLGDNYEIITDLDESTGVYFQALGLSIEQTHD
ncbi:MAG: TolC family protein [bacterium]